MTGKKPEVSIPEPPTPPENRKISTGSRWMGWVILLQIICSWGLIAYLNIKGVI